MDALHINKISARELISKTLPLPEAVIESHRNVMLELGKEYREKRLKVTICWKFRIPCMARDKRKKVHLN